MSTKTERAGLRDRFGGRDERVRNGDDDVARPDAGGDQRKPQRVRAAADADAVLGVAVFAKSFSNPCTIGPPMKPAVSSAVLKTSHSSSFSSACGVTRSRKGMLFVFTHFATPFASDSYARNTRAGFPATIVLAGTSLVTTLPGAHDRVLADGHVGKNRRAGSDRGALSSPVWSPPSSPFRSASSPSAVVARG